AVIGDHALAYPKVAAAPDPQDGEVAFSRVPAALRLDLGPAPEALPRLGIVQDRIVGVDRVLGLDVPALGSPPVLLQESPGPGVTIRCVIHLRHASGRAHCRRIRQGLIRVRSKGTTSGCPGRSPSSRRALSTTGCGGRARWFRYRVRRKTGPGIR